MAREDVSCEGAHDLTGMDRIGEGRLQMVPVPPPSTRACGIVRASRQAPTRQGSDRPVETPVSPRAFKLLVFHRYSVPGHTGRVDCTLPAGAVPQSQLCTTRGYGIFQQIRVRFRQYLDI